MPATQDEDDGVRRLLFHRAQRRELQPRLVANRSEQWMAKNVIIVILQLDPSALAVHEQGAKLVFRDVRCMQAAIGGPAFKKGAMDSALTSLLADYDSDADSNEDADVGEDDEDHTVAMELGVDVADPGAGDGAVDVEEYPGHAGDDAAEPDCNDHDDAIEAMTSLSVD